MSTTVLLTQLAKNPTQNKTKEQKSKPLFLSYLISRIIISEKKTYVREKYHFWIWKDF